MHAEAGDDLVHDQRNAVILRDLPQAPQELYGEELRPAALHRLHQDARQIVGVGFDPGERFVGAVVQHDHLVDRGLRDAGRNGNGARSGDAFYEHLVELPVIVAIEDDDLVATGDAPGKAHRRHHRLGARVAEGHALVSGDLRQTLRHGPGEF